ncbi:MAG TPA: hypothetical protein VFO93_04415 [Hymenobacter sp.]|uniref:hypothetical protein n=1 Tax=Hymenobacter sp. TaxID=1898978 RepID=UPI002D7E6856|nr:hypothetical protein [Hymenobacter sp.]HET9502758.1 hypothetical protein [Hymenobacter sp.]
MKTPILLVASLGLALAAHPAQAQVFRPGWVLLAQGDTLRGEVEDNAWEEAPKQVRFRAAAGADIKTYAAPELRAFRLREGRFFRLETLPLDRGAQKQLSYLTTWLTRRPQPETFLAEVLVDGPASLLRTAVADVQHYYVRRAGQPALELAERYYLQQQNGRQTIADGNNYQGELLTYFGDCPAAVQAIGRFEAPALVAVVQAYNRQCATPPQAGIEYRRASPHRLIGGFALGLVAGGRYTACQLQAAPASAGATLAGLEVGGGIRPVGGMFFDILAPGRHLALHFTGLLTRIGRRQELATPSPGLVAQLNNQVTLLEMRLGGRYFWSSTRRGQRFFVGSGISTPIALGSSEARLSYYNANGQFLDGSSVPDAYPFGTLPYLEVGVQQGRFTLAVDVRLQTQDTYRILSYAPQPQAGPTFLLSQESYSARNWYLGATLGIALWQAR